MKILAMSDTHGMHRLMGKLPEADLIIHAGDFSMFGTKEEALDFLEWFTALPYKYKVFVRGNHDDALLQGKIQGLPENCHYLDFSTIEIEGIKVCGIPFFVERPVNKVPPAGLNAIIEKEIDILVSHQPPYGILDYSEHYGHFGSHSLLEKVRELNPRYHIFGHMHEDYGIRVEDGTTFINCALMGESFERLPKSPVLFEINL